MIDFHSHILPAVDDGAQNEEISLRMLRRSFDMGVKTVVSTSHCYMSENENSADAFLMRRRDAYSELERTMKSHGGEYPNVVLGAEVSVYKGLSKAKNLRRLCIENTDYMLVEMPYDRWNDDVFEEIYKLIKLGIRPIIAHLDRFFEKEKQFPELLSLDVLMQINANSFFDKALRRKIAGLFEVDAVHVIGSDMHNLTSRPPNIAEAYNIIKERFGAEYAGFLMSNSQRIIANETIPPVQPPKISRIKKILM